MRHITSAVWLVILSCMALCSAAQLVAQVPTPQQPQALSGGMEGTEFFIAIPPNEILPFPVEGLEIYVASAFDANVELTDYSGDKKTRFKIKPYEILTLSDNSKTGKAVLNWSMEMREAEIPVRKALKLTSDKPISVYMINSKFVTTDGLMAIPINGWGLEYINCSY